MEENRRTNIFSALDDEEPQQVKQVVHVAEAEPSSAPVMLPELDNADWADMADEDDDFYRGASGTIDTLDDTFIPGQIGRISPQPEKETESAAAQPVVEAQPVATQETKPAESKAPKEPEVQLSKKELKQRELDELEAALAEFGLDAAPAESEEHAPEPAQEGGDSQASKKKKKKKPRKKAAAASTEGSSTTAAEAPKDVRAVLKQKLSAKSSSSTAGPAQTAVAVAAQEAKKKAAKSKSKKKDKSKFNQSPW